MYDKEKECESNSFKAIGMVFTTVTKAYSSNQIVKVYLENYVGEELLDTIADAVKPARHKSNKRTEVIILGQSQFDKFCEVASESNCEEGDLKETWLMTNILYTNDKDFSKERVPRFTGSKITREHGYDKDNVYCIRVVHSELGMVPDRSDDVVVYIPDCEVINR